MAKLDGLETVLDFLKGLQPKIAAQIAKKVMSLNVDPLPVDYKELIGYPGYYRIDSGEYRIVYRFDIDADLVEVILVGKRNDDEVYKQLKRLLG
ncbi:MULTISPECIES: type II toxin-antitoxin system RelE/ParE family toxin [Nostoc]|uniref:Type II toxin-antitoxin system RelE/ParE family toxin n=1 Tax=Nostoc paludosum FACHB-159 TaxID=2692908 RepID=A0ABR8KEN3_9NOSO|nr:MULTISPECIES: type II toxin-antitoxin system RelE/ParE family toxin [Nostoc]MBD2679654.1 type II toxin-antitoxin system RelE/ParE family toxin [Nostoc sp. FACHB-857]MBD2736643.1 type II toxin-antitoxin system RelE/ParE family toxin [Nostoc paludosum FACHB-159]